jgi:anaerobic selenocysteine-containing dehydrogenase
VEWDGKEWPKRVARRYTLVPTVCFNCESACGLLAYVDKDTYEIRTFEGNPVHPGSRGRNCAKGPATHNQVYDPERILYPLKRVGKRGEGKWERISWEQALTEIAEKMRRSKLSRPNGIVYHVGGRTLRILDFGKVAATFINTYTEVAIRIVPSSQSRSLALNHAPDARNDWEAMLLSYQLMPADDQFFVQDVHLKLSLTEIMSKPGKKAQCEICHEEIINGREVIYDGSILCRSCAGEEYYEALGVPTSFLTRTGTESDLAAL